MVRALHVFLLVDGQAAMGQNTTAHTEPAMLVPDLVSLLVLVKSTLKACCLRQEGHAKLAVNMLLLPSGPGLAKLNLLQVTTALRLSLYALHFHLHREQLAPSCLPTLCILN